MRNSAVFIASGLALAACSGAKKPGAPAVARVVVGPDSVFLPGVGQTRTLTATALDALGQPVDADITWNSSAPAQVSVDASGKVAAVAIGSAQVFAAAGAARSDPVLVVAAEPAPGALLVTDAQVSSVGDFIGLPAGELPDLGTQYEVRLTGVSSPPAPGTIVLAAEQAPVAGRVVSTRTEGSELVVLLEVASLPELMRNASIDWDIDLADYDWSAASATAPAATRSGRGPVRRGTGRELLGDSLPLEPFKPFDCSGSVTADLYNIDKTVTPSATAHLVFQTGVTDGQTSRDTRIELQGTYTINAQVKITLQAGIKGSLTCYVQQMRPINVGGWFSLILTPGVKAGIGLDLSAELLASVAELDLDGQAGVSYQQGITCPAGGGECAVVADWQPLVDVKPKLALNDNPALRLKVEGYLYGYVGLDALFGQGQVGDVEVLRAQIGPDQTSDLAFEDAQAQDETYASTDKLKWKGGLSAGAGIAKALKKLGASASAAAISKLQVPYSKDICQSPTGTFSADKQQVGVGQKVLLAMDLDPTTLEYFGFGYDVDSVQIWRRMQGGTTFEPLRAVSLYPAPSTGQSHFEGEWIPTAADVGTNTLAAFVTPKLLTELGHEIAPTTLKQVEVLCWPPHTATGLLPASGQTPRVLAAGAICEDAWNGSSSSTIGGVAPIDAQIKWVLDVQTTLPGSGVFHYYPTGTVSVGSWVDSQGCTVSYSPASYQITGPGDPQGTGELIVDYNPATPTYNGMGVTQWQSTITVACPDGSGGSGQYIAGGAWFAGDGTLNPDWLSFHGPYTSVPLAQTFTYAFSR